MKCWWWLPWLAVVPGAGWEVELRADQPAVDPAPAPALWAAVPDADRQPAGLSLTPASPYQWVHDGAEPVRLTAAATEAGEPVLLTVWDWHARPVARQRWAPPFSEPIDLRVSGRGTWLLTLDRFVDGACAARLARSFSVCPSARDKQAVWRAGPFQPGVCAFPGRQHWRNDHGPAHPPDLSEEAARALDAELSARLGLTLVRPDLPVFWRDRAQPIDFGLADAAFAPWLDRGLALALQMGWPGEADWAILPKYADVTDPTWRYPRQLDVVREFAEATARRYGPQSAFIELYNEPDNLDFWRGDAEEFIATHQAMAAGVRASAPGVPILSGGLCLIDPERTGQIVAGIRDQVDAVGYHSHGEIEALESAWTAMRAIHAAAGYAPPVFANTEMGFANWRLDMERHAAATAVQKLIFCFAHGHRAALLYCSRDIGGPRSSGDWGLLDFEFCPRFGYGAVAAFCDTFAGARPEPPLVERNGLYVYRFRRGDELLVPFFVGRDFPRPVTLTTDAGTATLLDPMGNSTPMTPTDGAIHLTAELYPRTLVLAGATRVELGG